MTEFDRLLAAGLTLLLGFQAMIILGGVSGLTPLTGITLPFVSFGASSLVAFFFAIGLLLHLSGKTLPSTAIDRATPEWSRTARAIALSCGAYLLLGVGVIRLFDVQGFHDMAIATRLLRTPDRDTVPGAPLPLHINPRLLAYASDYSRAGRCATATGSRWPAVRFRMTSRGRRLCFAQTATHVFTPKAWPLHRLSRRSSVRRRQPTLLGKIIVCAGLLPMPTC